MIWNDDYDYDDYDTTAAISASTDILYCFFNRSEPTDDEDEN